MIMKRKIGMLFIAVTLLAAASFTASAQTRRWEYDKHRDRGGRIYVEPQRNYGWGWGGAVRRDDRWDRRDYRWDRRDYRREERWDRRRYEPRIRIRF
jgi:hypothetical protein